MQTLTMRAWSKRTAARLEPLALASLSLGAAAIHFAVIGEHFAEYVLFGAFFALIGWFQALWALAYAVQPARLLGWLAIVANTATIGLWAWAHLVGLPFGLEPGQVEPTTLTDLMATLFEVLLVGWLIVIAFRATGTSGPGGGDRTALEPLGTTLVVALIVTVAIATTVALSQAPM